ncbi:hydroxymethylglutaryl-CoA lyase [Flavihumibacter fluvii]|uniref:hydroxymethylglutaryl-CoA lyase n=1 Tax=Flavihumibacter fluvii TaxID=2838157 RepID=UPI001BDF3BE8|nr:hydroxymethylglutaryl-CoA lyase [Flavihumibacter fluvii]ULQ54269.1 hydroxymethylglutaryl-CoA lyase [Flavihumibacter fluvii]
MDKNAALQLIECPRDAMQGWPTLIPAADKIRYINALLQVGFHTIDFGSFVSPKAIPQMADTKQVLAGLDLTATRSALLAIVANTRGAGEAVSYDMIRYIGFPFSVSATFQQRNTNSSIEASLVTIEQMQSLCQQRHKELVVYLSMGFGNPYGDPWSEEIVFSWARKVAAIGVQIISLADTVGLATSQQVGRMTSFLMQELPDVTIGVHLHATTLNWYDKVNAAFESGCRRFDGAMRGIGGCPMAGDDLVGNMDTLNLISYFNGQKLKMGLNEAAIEGAVEIADQIFRNTH